MRPFIVCAAVAFSLAACSSSTGVDLSQQQSLDRHQSQWEQSDPHSYSFVYTFHNLGFNSSVRITVRNDAVASVVDLTTQEAPEAQYAWPTIDQIFTIARGGLNSKSVVLDVQFDDQYGFPSTVSIAARNNNPGGGYGSVVSEFQPVD